MERLYTLQETAERLGLSYTTVRTYVHYGKIKATKQGKNRLVAESEIRRLKDRRTSLS